MKLTPASYRAGNRQRGWALLAVLSMAAVGLMVLAGVMSWASENATVAARNNEYFATSYAAEAATEKVLSSLSQDYQNYGFPLLSQNMSTYAATLPTASDGAYWTNYQFSGGKTANQIIVTNTATSVSIVMGAPYTGLNLVANTYEIIANAQNTTSEYKIVSTVGQQINLGTIPLFQFAIFYQGDMEIAPGAAMTISGPVHGNANVYLDPQDGLTFSNTVSAVGSNVLHQSPLDPTTSRPTPSAIYFDGSPASLNGVDPLNLPVGTNATGVGTNDSQNIYAILQPPTNGQGPTSSTGTNLLYNKADMIIIISNNNTISVTSGANVNSQATVISNNQWSGWLSTNGTFYDQRDSLTVDPVVLNVSNLVSWSATNTVLRPVLSSLRGSAAADVESIYVDDQRNTTSNVVTTNTAYGTNYSTNATTTSSYPAANTYSPPVTTNTTLTTNSSKPGSGTYIGSLTTNGSGSSKTYTYNSITGYTYGAISSTVSTNTTYITNVTTISQPGIVLSNGAYLPPQGLSIATPDPAYIIGNWNVQLAKGGTSDAGLSDTTYALPSAIYADAITILSSAWNPANSTQGISSRTATSDTVNAAFLTGNVPSNDSYYSGGVENFPRFMENWSGQTFTYNGSMVCVFNSQIADYPWPGTGAVYNPPTRNWAFDKNYSNPAKQPPMTPQVISVQRSKWALLAPYTTSF
jgi:hypothetical protein